MKELKGFLEGTFKIMDMCQNYREMKLKQRRYSPTKFRQMKRRLNMVDTKGEVEKGNSDVKKKMTVYFGHENWNLVLNIMVGLRKSIRALTNVPEIKESHFS